MAFRFRGSSVPDSGSGSASPVVNLLQHDDLRKGIQIALGVEGAGPDWKFDGVDRDHIPILRKLLLEGTAGVDSGVEVALPPDLATPGGTDVWNMEITRADPGTPEQLGETGDPPVRAHGDLYIQGSTTHGIRITVQNFFGSGDTSGAAGNAIRLDYFFQLCREWGELPQWKRDSGWTGRRPPRSRKSSMRWFPLA